MPKAYPGLDHCWGNPIAAIDFETTGRSPGHHEIIQVAVVILDSNFEMNKEIKPFYTCIAPQYPERAEPRAMAANGLDLGHLMANYPSIDQVGRLFEDWFSNLNLAEEKRLIPLAHNWSFESAWLNNWFGPDQMSSMFHQHFRDPMGLAIGLNDRAVFRGENATFAKVGLPQLCKKLGVVNDREHDAFCDCIAAGRVYRRLMDIDT